MALGIYATVLHTRKKNIINIYSINLPFTSACQFHVIFGCLQMIGFVIKF
jgi:hypothetical protein